MPTEKPLQDRVALVTGGGRGIGRATARQLAQLGASVAVVARSPAEVTRATREIQAEGGRALAVVADIGQHDGVRSAVDQVAAELGLVDILINNAALMPLGRLALSDPAEWRYTVEVNLIAPYECLRAVLPGMLARGWGRVVNVSSKVAVMLDMPNRSAYAASKAGLDRLTLAAAVEVAGTGVTVNAIYPGVTDTAMQAQLREAAPGVIDDAERDMWRDRHARGDLYPPAEGARLIAALVLSDLQGQIISLGDEPSQRLLRAWPEPPSSPQ